MAYWEPHTCNGLAGLGCKQLFTGDRLGDLDYYMRKSLITAMDKFIPTGKEMDEIKKELIICIQ